MLVTLYDKNNVPFEVNPNVAVKLLRTGEWTKTPRPAQEPVALKPVVVRDRYRPRRKA